MKATELMVGDYIMLYEDIYIIEEISSKGWAHIIYNDGSKCRVPLSSDYILDELTPVPLTQKILERNGFERVNGDHQDVFYVYDGIELLIDDGYRLFGQCKMPIMYVHELQHALRLCNINKEIEI